MAVLTPYWILDIIILFIGIILVFYAYFKLWARKYWQRRNMPYDEPSFIVGNMKDANFKRPFTEILNELYFKHKDKKLLGIWAFTKPSILINDVDLLKNILVKDFSYFHDRGLTINEELEPLTAHLFNMSGQEWRNMRVTLTPTFTSGKMKMMYETMYNVGLELQKHLDKKTGSVIEIKEVLACFTTDAISSCAFGIEAKSLEDPNSEFRKYGRMIFELPLPLIVSGIVRFAAPWIDKYIPLRQLPKAVSEFFMKVVKDVVQYREENEVKRNDFMELLIQLKNKGKIDDVDAKFDKDLQLPGVTESLRKYPAVSVLFRECSKDYQVPDSNIIIKKGDFLMAPIGAIQNDPKFFPDPERFDPLRFTAEERAKRDSFLQLTFGSGPRICIGNRFGLLQIKVGLVLILAKYNLEVCEKTPIPIVFDPRSFIPSPVNGMPLKITQR